MRTKRTSHARCDRGRWPPSPPRWIGALTAISVAWFATAVPLLAGETGLRSTDPSPVPGGGFGVGFSGELPKFVVQVPETKSEVAGEMVAKLGLSWVREWLAGTPNQTDAPLVPSPVLPQWQTASDLWWVGRVGFTPIGAAAGMVQGGLTGESGRKVDRAVPSISGALVELQIPDRFEPLLIGLLQEKVAGLVVLTNRLPHESGFNRSGLMEQSLPLPPEWRGMRLARADASAFAGTEAAVVIRVISWGLMGRAGRNSPLSVGLTVKATVVNLRDGTRGREIYAEYESPRRKFIAWGELGGKPLRDELRMGIQNVADQIAAQLPAPLPPRMSSAFATKPEQPAPSF